MMPTPGDRVRLRTDNPHLDGATAVVMALAPWGAFVSTSAAATGEYRAGWGEMAPASAAGAAGFTGDVCTNCGGCRLIRNGACCLCTECGTSSGCS